MLLGRLDVQSGEYQGPDEQCDDGAQGVSGRLGPVWVEERCVSLDHLSEDKKLCVVVCES